MWSAPSTNSTVSPTLDGARLLRRGRPAVSAICAPTRLFGLETTLGDSRRLPAVVCRQGIPARLVTLRLQGEDLRLQAVETVRKAGRQIRSTDERVEAARAGATLAQQRLESEQPRFESLCF